MCLQDVKLGKAWEQRSFVITPSTLTTQLVTPNSARRLARFAIRPDESILLDPQVIIYYLGDSPPVPIAMLTTGYPHCDILLDTHGRFVYGPFSVVDITAGNSRVGFLELLANTNEEEVVK